ncbi:phosphorylase [Plectonema radiosum NIES-515]|uniref:Phosphorylase n=1 Tax=Plectonema radiosum NIES-515 TaxID=2986073 RepID=A0ABT3B1L7_9CYAN|nr:phosphorylase [Plectonema radiosum]MCV3214905.1 phosphorylase [Plectonema radiosum NIES-515]
MFESTFPIIVVPQGAEYKAVCRGLTSKQNVIPIPVGGQAVSRYLRSCQDKWKPQTKVLVMGLCGSLRDRFQVGDIVLYDECVYETKVQQCDRSFTAELYAHLQDQVSLVKGLSCDRVVCSAKEKLHLGEISKADVVDMEGFAALEFFQQAGVQVAMLRVVSDDSKHDIPDLTSAINSDGSLQPLPLAITMIRQPIAATRLIRGSLAGLKVLEEVTTFLFAGEKI